MAISSYRVAKGSKYDGRRSERLSGRAETPCAPLAHGKVCGANAPLILPFRDVRVVCCVVFPYRLWLFFFLSPIFIFFFIFFISLCVVLLLVFFSLLLNTPKITLWGTQGVRRSDTRRLTQLVAPKQTGTPSFTQPRKVSAPMRGRAVAGRSTESLAVTSWSRRFHCRR